MSETTPNIGLKQPVSTNLLRNDVTKFRENNVTLDGLVAALQQAQALKAPLASPALTGTPTAPNLPGSPTDGQIVNYKALTDAIAVAVSDLLGGAPEAFNTLNELRLALGDDADFAATVTTALAGKLALDGSTAMTGDLQITGANDELRGILFQTLGSDRAFLGLSDDGESGSDSGSSIVLKVMDDAGGAAHTPLTIDRATGIVSMPKTPRMTAGISAGGYLVWSPGQYGLGTIHEEIGADIFSLGASLGGYDVVHVNRSGWYDLRGRADLTTSRNNVLRLIKNGNTAAQLLALNYDGSFTSGRHVNVVTDAQRHYLAAGDYLNYYVPPGTAVEAWHAPGVTQIEVEYLHD
jgi:hypothetical protein